MVTITDSLNDEEVLGLTLIGEARGESIEGQVAVANVIRNRVIQESKTYKQICLAPLQFSCWNQSDPNFNYLEDLAARMFDGQSFTEGPIRQCLYVAHGIINSDILDNTNGSIHYLANSLKIQPSWALHKTNVKIIGNQTFFNV